MPAYTAPIDAVANEALSGYQNNLHYSPLFRGQIPDVFPGSRYPLCGHLLLRGTAGGESFRVRDPLAIVLASIPQAGTIRAFVYLCERRALDESDGDFGALAKGPLQQPTALELTRYFRVRKTWEEKRFAEPKNEDIEFLREATARFKSEQCQELYRSWKAGRVEASTIASCSATQAAIVRSPLRLAL